MVNSEFTPEELATEEWRSITGFVGIYSVSNLGRVRRDCSAIGSRMGRLLIGSRTGKGYRCLALRKDGRSYYRLIHQVVAEAFIGPLPIGHEVNHEDGHPPNCRMTNLKYMTHQENAAHASRTGLLQQGDQHWTRRMPERVPRGPGKNAARGENHGSATLRNDEIPEIRRRYKNGEKPAVIVRDFPHATLNVVRDVCYGRTFKSVL